MEQVDHDVEIGEYERVDPDKLIRQTECLIEAMKALEEAEGAYKVFLEKAWPKDPGSSVYPGEYNKYLDEKEALTPIRNNMQAAIDRAKKDIGDFKRGYIYIIPGNRSFIADTKYGRYAVSRYYDGSGLNRFIKLNGGAD